jgi:hypothetical protein
MWYRLAAPPSKLVKNLYPDTFWVDKVEIKPGKEMGIVSWRTLLKTTLINVRNENNLLTFLNSRIIKDNRGRKVFQFFNAATLLPNPVEGGFWVKVKEENELGEIVLVPKFIPRGKGLGIVEWKELLRTDRDNINTEDKLRDFLSNDKFKYEGKKKFYIPAVLGNPTLLSNPIINGFWVKVKEKNELGEITPKAKFIAYGEEKGVKDWNKLLNTGQINSQDKDSLKKFLTDNKFEYVGKRKFYIPAPLHRAILISNPIPEVFYIDGNPIAPTEKKNIAEWTRLLKSDVLNTKDITLEQFLSDKLIRNEDGDLIYTYDPRKRSILFKNPIPEGFYVNGEPIEPSRTMGVVEWQKLLDTSKISGNNPNSLRDFLNEEGKITIVDGKKIYNPFVKVINLKNPLEQSFWVGNREIFPNEEMNVSEWTKLLNTDRINVNNEESLKDFLSDRRRFRTIKNRATYIPIKKSSREGLFGEKFYNYNNDDIVVKAGQYINVLANKTYYLYLDFAFKKNNKILLAVEINGAQHYGFVSFTNSSTYNKWQEGLHNDILKINYCHNNNIPLLIFNHMLSDEDFKTIVNNLHQNPLAYINYIPQPVIDNDVKNTSHEFIKRQIYSHLYPVFNNVISFKDDESKKTYIKDTLILISKLMGIYEGGIDKTDYIKSFNRDTDLTSNYNICLAIYNNLYPKYPLDRDEKITYSDLSKQPRLRKEKSPTVQKPKEIEENPLEI